MPCVSLPAGLLLAYFQGDLTGSLSFLLRFIQDKGEERLRACYVANTFCPRHHSLRLKVTVKHSGPAAKAILKSCPIRFSSSNYKTNSDCLSFSSCLRLKFCSSFHFQARFSPTSQLPFFMELVTNPKFQPSVNLLSGTLDSLCLMR